MECYMAQFSSPPKCKGVVLHRPTYMAGRYLCNFHYSMHIFEEQRQIALRGKEVTTNG